MEKSRSKSWVGNIYHKFEAVCQEVDEFVTKVCKCDPFWPFATFKYFSISAFSLVVLFPWNLHFYSLLEWSKLCNHVTNNLGFNLTYFLNIRTQLSMLRIRCKMLVQT